jgi:large subunit ribosomal protein L10
MPNTEKVEKVAALKERIEGSNALLLAEYRGISVHDATELRRSLMDQARFSVAKNTLLARAAGEAGIEGLEELLKGPTAVAFVEGDVVATAKKLVEAARRFPALVLKGAFMDGRVLSADEAKSLADLESREVMLSRVAGMLKSEMSRAAGMFQALQSRFVGVLEALRDKLPAAADEPAGEAMGTPAETEGDVEATVEVVESSAPEAPEGSEPTTDDEGVPPATEPAGATTDTDHQEGDE